MENKIPDVFISAFIRRGEELKLAKELITLLQAENATISQENKTLTDENKRLKERIITLQS